MTIEVDHAVLLYVEDDKAIQKPVIAVLIDGGFDVLAADRGAEALDCLASELGPIDGVIKDVALGRGPTGWNVARRARLRTATMPVVYASAASKDEWMANGVPLSKLLMKPFRPPISLMRSHRCWMRLSRSLLTRFAIPRTQRYKGDYSTEAASAGPTPMAL